MKKSLLLFLMLIISSSALYAAERIAIIPFPNATGMNERDYKAVYETFRNKVSENKNYELLSHDETLSGINEAELNKKKITTHLDTIPIGQYLGVSKIIYGDVGLSNQKLYLNVSLVDIKTQSVLNQVIWNIPVSANPFSFAEITANKLLWTDRDIYPNRAVVISNRKNLAAFNSSYYEKDMVKFLSSLNFPKSTEIIEVSTNIRENKDLSVFGCIGCVTLVGWVILPYFETKSEVSINIKLRYLDDFNNFKEVIISREFKDSSHYHLLRKEITSFSITGKVYARVKDEIKKDIMSRSELFVERVK